MNIEIWFDVVCPYCYLGKRRFEKALAGFEHRDRIELTWRSFELDPRAPQVFAGSLDEMLAQKYGIEVEDAKAMNDRVARAAAAEGLDYRLDRARPGNTFDAHRLLHYAADRGLGGEATERLFRAYFSDGRSIGDRATLVELAEELGLEGAAVKAALEGDAYADSVRADESRARELGITGVPFFVVDGRYGVSGAQEPETFHRALERAWSETRATAREGWE